MLGALGIVAGNSAYFALSALGLTAVLVHWPALFQGFKGLGAAYLVFVGLQMICAKSEKRDAMACAAASYRPAALFTQGLVTQIANPKATVFFSALVPQFIAPERGHVPLQLVILGVTSASSNSQSRCSMGGSWSAELNS